MAAVDSEIPEIIRLQLRKPKSWNWQLSTSKSSPNIVLPIIQLFDYKGQLLVEATDDGNVLRRCWSSSNHSSIANSLNINEPRRRRSNSSKIRKSRSDTTFQSKIYLITLSLLYYRFQCIKMSLFEVLGVK